MARNKHLAQIDMRVVPTQGTDVVRLADMAHHVASLNKSPVRAVFTEPFAGTYEPNGLILRQTTPAPLIADGITLTDGKGDTAPDRVLLTAQDDLWQNGIYDVIYDGEDGTSQAVLRRSSDFDHSGIIVLGCVVPVREGNANAGTNWVLSFFDEPPAILDTTELIFYKREQIGGGGLPRIVEAVFNIAGDDTTHTFPCTHNLGTLHVTHELYENATGDTVMAKFTRTDANTVTVEFGTVNPPASGESYTLVVRGEV